jgi:hypothetical protein
MTPASRAKPTALQTFETNIADARHLVGIAEAMTNTRARRMRRELRDRVGEALRIPVRRRDALDCLQSDHLFVTFMPGAGLSRADFDDARPLLRQALVAACAAGETYVADRAMERVGPLLNTTRATPRLRGIPMDLGSWLEIDSRYDRKKWGLRGMVIEPYIRQEASTDPTKVGFILSLLGVESPMNKLDTERRVSRGETKAFLERLTQRRNRIAHQGDRVGRGRAALTSGEVMDDLAKLTSVVEAIQRVTQP